MCAMRTHSSSDCSIESRPFGVVNNIHPVSLFTLRNSSGMIAEITNYGGILVSLKVPDRNGEIADVVLGYDSIDGYLSDRFYMGGLIGRCGNRIANARFELDGQVHNLAANDGPNALHGGVAGFDRRVWEATVRQAASGAALHLHRVSPDGEEGYRGNLSVSAIYSLGEGNELRLECTATTDKRTIVNLTYHPYFNLAGAGNCDILEHVVTINADSFTPVDSLLIPTGEIRPVAETPFDFRKPTPIGARIDSDDEQLTLGRGYDHNWVIDKAPGSLGKHATVYEPGSGRMMELYSNAPGLQFYSGNFLDGSAIGKGKRAYGFRDGFAMEPQHFPDSPNRASFPPVVLIPGETYRHTIVYRFSTAPASA